LKLVDNADDMTFSSPYVQGQSEAVAAKVSATANDKNG
jgi:hypothetical protein